MLVGTSNIAAMLVSTVNILPKSVKKGLFKKQGRNKP